MKPSRRSVAMSRKELLIQLIERLPEERLAEVERLVVSLLPADEAREPGARMTFEEAADYTFATFDETLRRLAE
jgi:hypothetical protein